MTNIDCDDTSCFYNKFGCLQGHCAKDRIQLSNDHECESYLPRRLTKAQKEFFTEPEATVYNLGKPLKMREKK
jgi:hypothetical protein